MQNTKSFDISVEEFDAISEEHVFSDSYNKRKAALLKSYKNGKMNKRNTGALKAAAAVLITMIDMGQSGEGRYRVSYRGHDRGVKGDRDRDHLP